MDRNLSISGVNDTGRKSLSARRAWIEILAYLLSPWVFLVALRKESVDRNQQLMAALLQNTVALRKESVDRNSVLIIAIIKKLCVALRKESVDRNFYAMQIIVVIM